jgi:hypothetical protein
MNATIYYRVSSTDAAGNTGTWPATDQPPDSFQTYSYACFEDTETADFEAGTIEGGISIIAELDGEIILSPAEGSDFNGTELPEGWTSDIWPGGGTVVVGGGEITVDCAWAATDSFYDSGRTLEFMATFGAQRYQHAGFAISFAEAAWAIFSTNNTSTTLYARTADPSYTDTAIPGSWIGEPHLYRIEWYGTSVDFYIDDSHVASHAVSGLDTLRPIISDYTAGGADLSVDWLRMSPPYAPWGVLKSRIYDAGAETSWGAMVFGAEVPSGTDLTMKVRVGDVPVPDTTWTEWLTVPEPGHSIDLVSRYIQYYAHLETYDSLLTPVVRDVAIQCVTVSGTEQPEVPGAYTLYQNVPNPFNPSTKIRFDVPTGGGYINVSIYDVSGRLVKTLVDERMKGGQYEALWFGRNNRGQTVSSGVYFCRLKAPGYARTRKLVLLR